MMQFMQGIPKDLDEAATIDGCSKYQIYSRILLPLMKPSIVTTVIIQFYWKWDDYMGPLLYLSRRSPIRYLSPSNCLPTLLPPRTTAQCLLCPPFR